MSLVESRSHIPLVNKPKVKGKKRTIPNVAPKRAKANREYAKRREDYLIIHPYCQIYLRVHNIAEHEVISAELSGQFSKFIHVPRSNQIHHSKKPKCKYLNDESTWFAASPKWHDWVENNKKEARSLGLLHDN